MRFTSNRKPHKVTNRQRQIYKCGGIDRYKNRVGAFALTFFFLFHFSTVSSGQRCRENVQKKQRNCFSESWDHKFRCPCLANLNARKPGRAKKECYKLISVVRVVNEIVINSYLVVFKSYIIRAGIESN